MQIRKAIVGIAVSTALLTASGCDNKVYNTAADRARKNGTIYQKLQKPVQAAVVHDIDTKSTLWGDARDMYYDACYKQAISMRHANEGEVRVASKVRSSLRELLISKGYDSYDLTNSVWAHAMDDAHGYPRGTSCIQPCSGCAQLTK